MCRVADKSQTRKDFENWLTGFYRDHPDVARIAEDGVAIDTSMEELEGWLWEAYQGGEEPGFFDQPKAVLG